MSKIRALAYYLPQFHPIPENDEWWGKGFTEWTNVVSAKPLFKDHIQPKIPADLGFYDLRVPEVREQQAELAKNAGIEGFCYWHYWFGNGKQLLERPFKEVLKSGKPDFPFCLGWANESWTGIWHGAKDKILIKQEYPGIHDYEAHFNDLLPAFLDKRYIRVDDKPLFLIYQSSYLPDKKEFSEVFNHLAVKNGLKGIYLVASNVNLYSNPLEYGFNASTYSTHSNIIFHDTSISTRIKLKISKNKKLDYIYKSLFSKPLLTFTYRKSLDAFLINEKFDYEFHHTIITGFDNTPRSGKNGFVLNGYSPELFRIHVKQVLSKVIETKHKIVFIKSWNEWAEGNYLEPDTKYGTEFLDIIRDEINILNKS